MRRRVHPVPSAEFVRVLRHWNAVGAARLDDALAATSARPRMSVVSSPGVDVERVLGVVDAIAPADARPGEPAVVLLVVLDASTPIGLAVLTPLRQVPASVRVAMALENTERFDDWPDVRDRDRRLIAEYVPALAAVPIRAIPSENGALMSDVADAARGTDLEWAARTAHRELDHAVDGARRAIAAAGRRPSRAADMEAARSGRAAAIAGRDGNRSERIMSIRNRTTLLRVELVHEVADEIRRLSHGTTSVGRDTSGGHGKGRQRDFAADIDAAAARLDARLRGGLSELGLRSDRIVDAPSQVSPPPRRPRGAEELLAGALGASAGAGLGRLIAAMTSAGAGVAAAAMIAAGLLLGTLTILARSRAADRAHLHRWSADVLSEQRSNWEQRVVEAVLRAESDLTDDVTAATRRDRAAADAEIARLDDRIRTLSMSNNGRGAGLERDLAALERGADAVRADIVKTAK